MGVLYGGRLGAILAHYPRVQCPECESLQVQIVNYLSGDAGYKCRRCKHKFELPFDDKGKEYDL